MHEIAAMDQLTPLAHWMESAAVLDQQLADKVGCDRSTITRLRLGRATPSLHLAAKLIDESKGRLQARDFLPKPKRRRAA